MTDNNTTKPVYTIGYTLYPNINTMMSVLKSREIDVIIDVRSSPWSKTFPQYNKPNLMKACEANGLYYRHYSREFGARQRSREFSVDGQVNFERFSDSEQFQEGVRKVIASAQAGYTLCLFCAEKDPIICHRSILVGRALHERGIEVIHITSAGRETQEELEQRLVDLHFPNRDQAQIWEDPLSSEEMRQEAYRRQNWKIGYRLENFA